MKNSIAVALCLLISAALLAQQTERAPIRELNNESVIKLMKSGLSDDLIISTINASPGKYDISPDGLDALKKARVSDTIVAAVILKAAAAAPASPPSPQEPPQNSLLPERNTPNHTLVADLPQALNKPRVFLQSASKGTNRNAARDQSMEMSKDLEKECPGVRVTINQSAADYTVLLNHIEAGFVRDNQFQVANRDGDLLTRTKEGGSIASGMKKVCALILAEWSKK